jgi:ABC-2 type transport system ATP-binding protein
VSIIVNNINKVYGSQKALNDVSFEVESGKVVGFLGPNGAGKSTMMKIITCYIPQTSGEVNVCGYDVTKDPMEVKRNIGYLAEHNPLYHDMYVKEYLQFIAGLHHIGRRTKSRIDEMIEITGLVIERNKKIGALSKGYRQRVGLAQALIHDPKVLILDEPTTGLDPNQLSEIRNLIKQIGKEKTVMLSTHIMQEVEAVCDRVIIINKGEIVANDLTGEIQKLSSDKQMITVEFDKSVKQKDLEAIKDVLKTKKVSDTVWQIQSHADKDVRNAIFQFAVQNQIAVLGMQKEEQSLEQVFQKLTK